MPSQGYRHFQRTLAMLVLPLMCLTTHQCRKGR